MKTLYYTRISVQAVRPADIADPFVAEVAFATETMPHQATGAVLDSLVYLGVHRGGTELMTVIRDTIPLVALPQGLSIDKPEWSDGEVDVWILRQARKPQEETTSRNHDLDV